MKTIEFINENEILIDGSKFIKDEPINLKAKCNPEFKVGQWVIGKKDFYPYSPSLIINITGETFDIDDFAGNNQGCGNLIRPAMPQEIESHLRKICDEKYIGKKVKCLVSGRGKIIKFWEYDEIRDVMKYTDTNSNPIWLYKQGKFAEIIPDKKKLPKTKEECKKFLDNYDLMKNLFPSRDANWFLNEYED